MASSTNVDIIINAKDNASAVLKNVGASAEQTGRSISETFKTGGIAAAGFIAAIAGVGAAMINVASDFEQNRISFETMLGSAEKGRKALQELSDFAVATPFELPQLMTASKSLLAYGIEADKLIPTLKVLGDIASGVGMDKLPNLVLAFGQVKAATKLTGMELRQFTEAGVPLLQALVDQANKAGGQWVTVGGVAQKTKDKLDSLNTTLVKQTNRLTDMTDAGKTSGASYKNLNIDIQNTKDKIAALGDTTGTTRRVFQKTTVTVAQMKDMISDGSITFEQVQDALKGMTEKGGRFFDLMEKQSHTFGGVMSNIKDQVTRSLAEIAGIDIAQGGIIREGSLFAVMKQLAEGLLNVLNVATPIIVKFTKKVTESGDAIAIIGGAIGGAFVLAIGAFWATFGAGILVLLEFMAIGAAVGAIVMKLIDLFGGWENVVKKGQRALDAFVKFFVPKFQRIGQLTDDLREKLASKFLPPDLFLKAKGSWLGFLDAFSDTYVKPKIERAGQLIQQFKDDLVFGSGDTASTTASWTQVFDAIYIKIKDKIDQIKPIVMTVIEVFKQIADFLIAIFTPAWEGLVQAFKDLQPIWDQFVQSMTPLIPTFQTIGVVILMIVGAIAAFVAALLVGLAAIIVGFISAIGPIITFVTQFLSGLIQIISGALAIIVGIFTMNGDQVLAGIMAMWNGIWLLYDAFTRRIIAIIDAFVKGIINFFVQLYDALIGHSIIPDLINGAIGYFIQMKDTIVGTVSGLVNAVIDSFNFLKTKVEEVIGAIKSLIDNFKPKFKIDIELPDIAGAWNSLKNKAHDLHIPGFQTGGIVPGPIGAPVLAQVHGGEEIRPVGRASSGGGGGGASFNVYIGMYAGTDTEKRNVAKDLYAALLQVAQSQHKTVQEFMGG